MNRALMLTVGLLLTCFARAEDAALLVAEGTTAYNEKNYPKAIERYEAAMKAGAKSSAVPYNAACCFALLGNADEAFAWLDRSIEAGWRDVEHLRSDPDLISLHDDTRWSAVIKRCEAENEKFLKSIKEPERRAELLKRMKEDQRIRFQANPDMGEWHRIDADNTAFMKQVIEKHGWPGKSLVGADAAQAAWLMVQHADADPAFQQKCLDLLKVAYEKKEATGQQVAYLTDRVLVAEGKKQLYGTQFFSVFNGEPQPQPIEDEANLDARRKEMGLEPFAEYEKLMRSQTQPKPSE